MSKLQIRYIECDTCPSLADFTPGEDGFVLHIELGIGESDKKTAEPFFLTVCDQRGLFGLVHKDVEYTKKNITSLSDYNLFVMKAYNYEEFLQYIDNIIKTIPAEMSWKQKAMSLSRYFEWEGTNDSIKSIV